MKHLKYFPDSQTIGGGVKVDLPNVSYLEGENTLFISGNEGQATVKVNSNTGEIEAGKPDYSQMYLSFEAIESGTFRFLGATSAHTLSYSLDDGDSWTTLADNTDTPTINAGSKIMWKGDFKSAFGDGSGTFSATGKFNIYGNVMSLLYGDNFIGQTDLTDKAYAFSYMFDYNTEVVSAQNLILPATTLAEGCYSSMFQFCSSLTTAPELPATTLAKGCYETMFVSCTSLTTAPVLPATTLADSCYCGMFQGCTSLTTAPELPATTLAEWCYSNMFQGCTSLTTAPVLPATTLAGGCYGSMFQFCSSLTTAPELPATTLASDCYRDMFNGCTSLTTAPVLPATTLTDYCYWYMFSGCTNINYIKMLATDVSASSALYNWVNGVSSTGTFIKAAGVTIPTGTSGIPTGWTVQTTNA